jgi:uncharacterized protein YeeX (DUF496 family)
MDGYYTTFNSLRFWGGKMKFYFVPYHLVKDKVFEIIENNKDDFKETYGDVDVDYGHFDYLSSLGMAYVAMAVEGDVVGIAGFVINENMTHKEMEAENVVIYFDKKHRKNLSKDLIQYAKDEFKKLNVNKMVFTVKNDGLGRLLRMNDFKKEYETWGVSCE